MKYPCLATSITTVVFVEAVFVEAFFMEAANFKVHLQDIQVDVCCTKFELYSFILMKKSTQTHFTKLDTDFAMDTLTMIAQLKFYLLCSMLKLYSSKFVQQTSTWMSWRCTLKLATSTKTAVAIYVVKHWYFKV